MVVNLPAAGLCELGLDYSTLKDIRADIILTPQTAYGHAGPWAERGGFDGVAVADFPVAMSGTRTGLRKGAPGSGERAGEALGEAGYSAEAIADLRRAGVI